MRRCGATFDKNVGAARASTDAQAAIGCFASGREIAAGDSGSHLPVPFYGSVLRLCGE
jgi:hypothetical protein